MIEASRLTGHDAECHGPLPPLIERPGELQAVVEDLADDYIESWRPGKKAFKREAVKEAKHAFDPDQKQGKPVDEICDFFRRLFDAFYQYSKELKIDGQLYKSFKILQGKIDTSAPFVGKDFKEVYNKIEDFLRLFPDHEQVAKFEESEAKTSYSYGAGTTIPTSVTTAGVTAPGAGAGGSVGERNNSKNPFDLFGLGVCPVSNGQNPTTTSMSVSGGGSGKSTNPFVNPPTSGGSTATNTANPGEIRRGASSKGLNPFGNTTSSDGAAASTQVPVSNALGEVWHNRAEEGWRGNYDPYELFKSGNSLK